MRKTRCFLLRKKGNKCTILRREYYLFPQHFAYCVILIGHVGDFGNAQLVSFGLRPRLGFTGQPTEVGIQEICRIKKSGNKMYVFCAQPKSRAFSACLENKSDKFALHKIKASGCLTYVIFDKQKGKRCTGGDREKKTDRGSY